jgi:hypothetical protein
MPSAAPAHRGAPGSRAARGGGPSVLGPAGRRAAVPRRPSGEGGHRGRAIGRFGDGSGRAEGALTTNVNQRPRGCPQALPRAASSVAGTALGLRPGVAPRRVVRTGAVAARAMVNVDFASPSLVLGAALIGVGVLLLQVRAKTSRDPAAARAGPAALAPPPTCRPAARRRCATCRRGSRGTQTSWWQP